MAEQANIEVFEVVGNGLCVASDDGQKVYEQISKALKERKRVSLSFRNVQSLTSAFLNAAIGQLYGEYTSEQLRGRLRVSEMAPEDMALLKRVVDTAKAYFKDPGRFTAVRKSVLEEDDAR